MKKSDVDGLAAIRSKCSPSARRALLVGFPSLSGLDSLWRYFFKDVEIWYESDIVTLEEEQFAQKWLEGSKGLESKKKHILITPGGGSLGSQIDEERSQLREARRIAGLHETVNGRTHIAALAHGSGPHPPEGHLT